MIGPTGRNALQSKEWIIVVALSLLVTLLRLPSLEQPFDNDSGANAYHARLIVRGEPLYSTHHPAHHMPAVYYAYALAFLLFGDSVWAVKFLLILWTIVTVYLLYRLGVLMRDRATGALAAVFYSILTSHVHMAGTTAEIELFANLPRIAAILVLMHFTAQRATAWKFVLVGMLSAAAFLFKAIYLSSLAIAGFVLVIELWPIRSQTGARRITIMRGLWIAIGFAAGLLPVVAYFGLLGLLPRFLLAFTIGRGYVNFRTAASAGPEYLFLYPFLTLAANNIALLTLSVTGLLLIVTSLLRRHHPRRGRQPSTVSCIPVWYILSFVEAGITRVNFSHYYLLVVPSLALLAAWFLCKMYRDVSNQVRTGGRFAAASLLMLLLAITLSLSATLNLNFYRCYARYRLGLETYQDFVRNGVHWGESLVRVQRLADYVRRHTSPNDRIYYWSGDTQIYYLADRRCAIDIIWPLYAEATGPYQRIFSPQTKYVILGESNNIPRPAWLYAGLVGEYALETVIEDQEVYRRLD